MTIRNVPPFFAANRIGDPKGEVAGSMKPFSSKSLTVFCTLQFRGAQSVHGTEYRAGVRLQRNCVAHTSGRREAGRKLLREALRVV